MCSLPQAEGDLICALCTVDPVPCIADPVCCIFVSPPLLFSPRRAKLEVWQLLAAMGSLQPSASGWLADSRAVGRLGKLSPIGLAMCRSPPLAQAPGRRRPRRQRQGGLCQRAVRAPAHALPEGLMCQPASRPARRGADPLARRPCSARWRRPSTPSQPPRARPVLCWAPFCAGRPHAGPGGAGQGSHAGGWGPAEQPVRACLLFAAANSSKEAPPSSPPFLYLSRRRGGGHCTTLLPRSWRGRTAAAERPSRRRRPKCTPALNLMIGTAPHCFLCLLLLSAFVV